MACYYVKQAIEELKGTVLLKEWGNERRANARNVRVSFLLRWKLSFTRTRLITVIFKFLCLMVKILVFLLIF